LHSTFARHVVLLFTPTEQAISGTLDVGKRIPAEVHRVTEGDYSLPHRVPVPSRFDFDRRPELGQEWLNVKARRLDEFFDTWNKWKERNTASPLKIMKQIRIPHKARSLFGECLPVTDDAAGDDPASIAYAYKNIAALLAQDLKDVDILVEARDRYVQGANHRWPSEKEEHRRGMAGEMDPGWEAWDRPGSDARDSQVILTPPIVGQNADGRLQVFARRTDDRLWSRHEVEPASNAWSDWVCLKGVPHEPTVSSNWDGRLEVFACGSRGDLWHKWQLAPNSPDWSEWHRLGGVLQSAPAARVNEDGRLQVFARLTDGAIWYRSQKEPGTDAWSNWDSLFLPSGHEGGMNDPQVTANYDKRLEIFALGGDGALWHIWQLPANTGENQWSAWESLGGILQSAPAVARNEDGRLEVFVRGTDRKLWHIWQTRPGSHPWSRWESRGGGVYDPKVVANANGTLAVFVRGNEHNLWHKWQTVPNGAWSEWKSLGGIFHGSAAVALNAKGQPQVFVQGTIGVLWRRFAR
jgi:hypothetical protein